MNLKYSREDLLASARQYKTIGEWRRADRRRYGQALRRGLMLEVYKFLVPESGGRATAYTDAELAENAKRFATRAEWDVEGKAEMARGEVSHYHCALGRGPEFFKKYCQRMQQHRRWTDDELIGAASSYKHKGAWKRSNDSEHRVAYQLARRRPEVFTRATAHMTPKTHPYSGSYTVYAYEFTDHWVYVGLTFRPQTRHAQHMVRGRVYNHIKLCSTYAHKTLEQGINDPATAAAREREWIAKYRAEGWQMLNDSPGGGLGTIQVTKWTKEAVVAEARKYTTKQAWIDRSQMSYRIAKREGWFDEASAHMPRRVLGIGAGRKVSAETRQKQREAKLGKAQTAAQRQSRSAAIKNWWSRIQNSPTAFGQTIG